ncbi:hypothetical protein ACI6Q2_08930 [Chitinophagaceae bacterium LWZ2-11]
MNTGNEYLGHNQSNVVAVNDLQLACLVIHFIKQENVNQRICSTTDVFNHLFKFISGVSRTQIQDIIDDLFVFGILQKINKSEDAMGNLVYWRLNFLDVA